ncbi:multiple epidermal growth factor-like domains protein 8 [Dermatophagoides farinae]|uniref:Multiple epidermal growth factor-like domains protein 8 n=1 Tax=Dermatophagoides farinae TaxID=6954 RepID=A0A9D4NS61_DERFA|nr:multiple epidermal growth factor-like domains protein 8 [Dermatophagoides farinae]
MKRPFIGKYNFILFSFIIWISFSFILDSYAISDYYRRIISSNDTIFGTITNDRDGEHEWLFKTNDPLSIIKFINIQFIWINLSTCNSTTDTIYLFNGDSYEDRLIGSIHGPFYGQSSQLKPFVGNRNRLLMIYHRQSSSYDDLPTFSLQYSFTNCPLNCTNNGHCINNQCHCNDHYGGDACDLDTRTEYDCPTKRIGSSCNININDVQSTKWFELFSNQHIFSARASHDSVYDRHTDQIYTFGGRSYESIYGDLLSFSITKNKWFNLTDCDNKNTYNNTNNNSTNQPKPRWGHTMNIINDSLIIFGGIGADGHQFNDLWIYNLTNCRWIQSIDNNIPALAFHVAIIVDNQWLHIHGGRFENSTYSSNIYRINLLSSSNYQWELVRSLNKGRTLAAHTAIVYNRSIIVFGGISGTNGKLSNAMYQYDIDHNYWSKLRYSQETKKNVVVPEKRAFHSMIFVDDDDDYLVIFGGFIQNNDCLGDGSLTYAFSLKSRYWTKLNDISEKFPFKSIISHTLVRRKNLLFIIGGYYGQIRNEIFVTQIHWNSSSYFHHYHHVDNKNSELIIWKYFNVPNISMPDVMTIQTVDQMTIPCQLLPNEQMIRIFGFIHPFGAQTFDKNSLRIYLHNDDDDDSKNNNSTFESIEINTSSFVNHQFIDYIIHLPIRIVMDQLDYDSDIQMTWNVITTVMTNESNNFQLSSFIHAQDQCHSYSDCYRCLTNVACVWCPSRSQCLIRNHYEMNLCSGYNEHNLMIDPEECIQCFNVDNCQQCLQQWPYCQWLVDYELCVRRGRIINNSIMITNIENCPMDCAQRNQYEHCVDGNGNCIWCESMNKCLRWSQRIISELSLFDFCRNSSSFIITNDRNVRSTNECAMGTYGNSNSGCLPCNCNGHANLHHGVCHSQTGICFCQDNTEGYHCDRCRTGYYGDPRNGGICFQECQNKAFISMATFGHFGSYIRSDIYRNFYSMKKSESQLLLTTKSHCMWIISTGDEQQQNEFQSESDGHRNPVQINIFQSFKLNCSHSTLIIYDGIPDIVSADNRIANPQILASICGANQRYDLQFIAYSGIATVLYKTDNHPQQQGFNASYQSLMSSNLTATTTNQSNSSSSSIILMTKIQWPLHSHTLEYFDNFLIFIGGHPHSKHHLDNNQWIQSDLESNSNGLFFPSNRYLHATALIQNKLYVYGGLDIRTNEILSEFWCLSFANDHHNSLNPIWINLTATVNFTNPMNHRIPPLVGHTLTKIKFGESLKNNNDDGYALILIGGFSTTNGYSFNQYIYRPHQNEWILLMTKGPSPLGIVGHSTVYQSESNMIYVFGGLDFKESHKMAISNTLYTLDCQSLVWHRIQPRSVLNSITPLYLHYSISFRNYMFVFGGKKIINDYRNDDTTTTMKKSKKNDYPISYAYFYKCNRWIAMINSSSKSWSIETIRLPDDFCKFFSNDQKRCLSTDGCSYCQQQQQQHLNETLTGVCFDQSLSSQKSTGIETLDCLKIITSDKTTTTNCATKKECNQFTNCGDCTAANYESSRRHDDGCQWCADCHMANGQCLRMNDTCQWENEFTSSVGGVVVVGPTTCSNISLIETDHCSTRRCLATDCQKCLLLNERRLRSSSFYHHHSHHNHQLGDCIWTKQVYKFIRFGHSAIPTNPIFDWACIDSSIVKYSIMKNVPTIPPLDCPKRCNDYNSCTSCLEETNTGDESGSHECVWSELTNECMSPTYMAIKCQHGFCGIGGGFIYRLHHTTQQCPPECETFEKAVDCLSLLHCGWCAIDGLAIDGVGFCLQGGLFGPKYQSCSNQSSIDLLSQLNHKPYYVPMTVLKTSWHYIQSPPENECLNGHHTCDMKSQNCIDLDEGFMCQCKSGYRMYENNNICKPICQQGCVYGICAVPDVCRCHFGYIGDDCSIECQCNGHSTCPSADQRNICNECHNNTQGKWCEKCKPFFVGDPTTTSTTTTTKNRLSSSCQPCFRFCHNHSELCFDENDLQNLTTMEITKFDDDYWHEYGRTKIQHGPLSEPSTICVNCKNNTEGERCDRCRLGYFKISDNIHDGCRNCMCNGHGTVCNPYNGENCDCHNNTENDRQCNYMNSKEYSNYINKTYFFKSSQIMTTYSLPCWMLQCSKCKDYFYGQPTGGHQCYRHMYLDKEYCIDPQTQENCLHHRLQQQKPLLNGRTMFFGIQPRYMNVDIRLIVYAIEGRIDLYLASRDDIFIVKVDPENGFHRLFIDKKYLRNISQYNMANNDSSNVMMTTMNETKISDLLDLGGSTNVTLKSPYQMILADMNGEISSYFTMKNLYEIIVVKNIENRLEITIPYRYHDLRTTRYYIMIHGSFHNDSDENQAFIVLRQDQSRIDLFIFFCVFLSCFFLFLSMSIMFYRVKQIISVYRARHLQEIELEYMANRPFTSITVVVDDDDDVKNRHESPEMIFRPYNESTTAMMMTPSSKQYRRTTTTQSIFRQLTSGFKESPRKIYPADHQHHSMMKEQMKNRNENLVTPMPVSIEFTNDNMAAIFTTLIRFPNDDNSNRPIQMAAASTLIWTSSSSSSCPSIIPITHSFMLLKLEN